MGIRSAVRSYLRRPIMPGPSYGPAISAIEQYVGTSLVMPEWQRNKPLWPEKDASVFDRQGYRQVALIFRCLNLIGNAAGVAKVRVYDESRKDVELADHPMRRLIRQPNPQMGEAIFWANVVLRMGVAGFCVVEKERDRLGNVIGLWPLESNRMRAISRSNAPHDWEYRVPGIVAPFRFKASDVVVFRWAETPTGSPYGIGPVEIGIRSAGIITKLIDFLSVLLDRGGVPMWGLVLDTMPGQTVRQDQVDGILENFLRRHGGIENAALPAVLAGIKDIKRLGFDLDELAYTDLRDVSELEIVQAFGVPPTKAMIRVGLEHSDSRANAAVDDATFYRDTMLPLWTRLDDALTTSLLPDFEDSGSPISLEFDTSDISALQPDRNEMAGWLLQGFELSVFSQHDVRKELGFPLPKTADFYVRGLSVDVFPVDDPMGEDIVPVLPPPAIPAVVPPPQLSHKNVFTTSMDDLYLLMQQAREHEITAGRGPQWRLAVATDNRKQIAKIASSRKPSISAFFRAQGERVIAAVRAPVGVAALVSSNGHQREQYSLIDINWAIEQGRLLEVLSRLYTMAGETSFAAVSGQLGISLSWDLRNPNIKGVMDQLGTRVVGINEQSRQAITQIVADGQNAGLDLDQIAENLKTQFTDWAESRALTIARTESMASYGLASAAGYRESGIVSNIQMFDNPLHTTDPGTDGLTCAQRDQMIVPLADAEKHIFAEHPNGSLAISPVVGEDEE